MFADLVKKCRTIRRFEESRAITRETLLSLVDLARQSASGGNNQPLKYWLSCDTETNAVIFPELAWAGYLTEWPGPDEGERPAAYIIILSDREISKSAGCDHGIAAQTIALGAAELGIGCCMIGSMKREALREKLDIPERFEILLTLALGYPAETVVLEEAKDPSNIKYWRDEDSVHHVPKRPLSEIVVN